jgi:molecular chaperone GrpE
VARDEAHEDDRAAAIEGDEPDGSESIDFKVEDRRHWQRPAEAEEPLSGAPEPTGIVGELRRRAEEAERKLTEYIEAFKRHQTDQEQFRERLARDVERRVELSFGGLVGELLDAVDHLDMALSHVDPSAAREPLAEGVRMARDHFLRTLTRHGVERIDPTGAPFDPNEAEALRVDAVDSAAGHDVVTETLKPGYRLGNRIVRAAKVAVGRYRGEAAK